MPIDSSPTEGSSNPISSGAIYTLATELNTEIYGRPTSSDVNNLIAAASIDYETQVMNKPTIPTAASIQAELAYDTTPTENSSNLIKSGDLYSV